MPEVRIGSEIKTYPQGTAYAEIAEEYQKNYENDILLVSVNGRLRELHKTLQKDCQMEFITAADTAGYLAYQRSAVFLMMKAFQNVAGRENVKNITVCFSVENGLYVEVEGRVTLSQELLDRVKAEMKRLSEQDLPLQKRSENTDEAMDHFQEQGMYDKARLFNYRRASRVNVYRLGDYDDYFYGYMVMSTGISNILIYRCTRKDLSCVCRTRSSRRRFSRSIRRKNCLMSSRRRKGSVTSSVCLTWEHSTIRSRGGA